MLKVKQDGKYLKLGNEVFNITEIAVVEIGKEYNEDIGMFRLRVFQPNGRYIDLEGTHSWELENVMQDFSSVKQVLKINPEFVSMEKTKLINLSLIKDIQFCEKTDKTYTKICFESLSFKCGKNYPEAYTIIKNKYYNYVQNNATC